MSDIEEATLINLKYDNTDGCTVVYPKMVTQRQLAQLLGVLDDLEGDPGLSVTTEEEL